ncbi:MAG TPA: hypothetical protein VIM89_08550 [Mucilaginibacter sp.]
MPDQLFIDKDGWENHFAKSDLEDAYDFEDALTINWWNKFIVTIDQLFPFIKNIVESPNGIDGLRYFGDADTNNICVSFDENTNQVDEVSCRVDLRKLDKDFINSVFSLARQFNCLLMDRQGRLFEPSRDEFIEKVKLSDSYRFVVNPEKFLNDLSDGLASPE